MATGGGGWDTGSGVTSTILWDHLYRPYPYYPQPYYPQPYEPVPSHCCGCGRTFPVQRWTVTNGTTVTTGGTQSPNQCCSSDNACE